MEIRKDFMPRNMASIFNESSMTHVHVHDSHGVLKGVNATLVCREMKSGAKKMRILIWVGRELMVSHMEFESRK